MTNPAQEAAERQAETPLAVCGTCGEPVVLYGGRQFRTCDHVVSEVTLTQEGIRVLADSTHS